MDSLKGKEEAFFDRHVADPHALKIYQQIQGLDFEKPFTDYFDLVLGDLKKLTVLEYGCGNYGDLSLSLVKRGARVVAFDLSGESVKSTHRIAAKFGLERQISALKMDCEFLSFKDKSFDLVVGRAILHHLDLDVAAREIKRVLKPGGRAVFIEPMGMNPLINLYRRFTPDQRTPGEHPFTYKMIRSMNKHFKSVEHREFNLFPLFIFVLSKWCKDKRKLIPALRKLQSLDKRAFEYLPALSRFSWTTVINCSL